MEPQLNMHCADESVVTKQSETPKWLYFWQN